MDGGRLSSPHNGRGNGRGITLLTVFIEDLFQLLIGPGIHHRVGGEHIPAVHTHIQGRIRHVGKAPVPIVQLWGGHTQVQQNAVHSRNSQIPQNGIHLAEIGVDQRHSVFIRCQPLSGGGQSHRIPIDADQTAGGQVLRNMAGVTGTAQGTVHINALRLDVQPLDALLQKHRNVMKFAHSPIASKDASSFSGVRFSCSKRLNSSVSQISA